MTTLAAVRSRTRWSCFPGHVIVRSHPSSVTGQSPPARRITDRAYPSARTTATPTSPGARINRTCDNPLGLETQSLRHA